jgi:aldose 1-epimerase
MYKRDATGIPTGNTVAPGPHPWDDCFAGVEDSPVLQYRDGVEFILSSDCNHWVVYEPETALCVEPQSGPTNGLTLQPHVVEPGSPLSRTFVIAWQRVTGG